MLGFTSLGRVALGVARDGARAPEEVLLAAISATVSHAKYTAHVELLASVSTSALSTTTARLVEQWASGPRIVVAGSWSPPTKKNDLWVEQVSDPTPWKK